MTTQHTSFQSNESVCTEACSAATVDTGTETPDVAFETQGMQFPQAQTNHSIQDDLNTYTTAEIILSSYSLRDDILSCKILNNGYGPDDLLVSSEDDRSVDNSGNYWETPEMSNTSSQPGQEHMFGRELSSEQSRDTSVSVAKTVAKTKIVMQQQNGLLQDIATPTSPPVVSSSRRPVSQPTSRDQTVRQYYSSVSTQASIAETPLVIADRVDGNQYAVAPVVTAYRVDDNEDYQSRVHKYQMLRLRRFLCLSVYLLFMGLVMYFVLTKMKKSNHQRQEMSLLFNLTQHNPQGQLIASIMGADAVELNNESSPYTKALIWLLQSNERNESQQMQESIAQRFYAAAFYFSTTTAVDKWAACNPVYNYSKGHDETCYFPNPPNDDDDSNKASPESLQQAWLSDSHECEWAGVRCDNHQQIIGLGLYDMNLVGVFPTSVAKFPFLGFLSLQQSQLSSNIPMLSDFHHLISLNLRSNLLSGDLLSTSIWQNRKLRELEIGNNRLTGSLSPQIGDCVDLKWLSLTTNQMTGMVPSEIGWLDSIDRFDISINAFRGTLVPSIQLWRMIRTINIGKNSFTDFIPTFLGQFNNTLKELHLNDNKFEGSLPDEIFQLGNLIYLDVSDNELNGTLDERLAQFPDNLLETFDISDNRFTGTIPTELGLLTSLKYISLDWQRAGILVFIQLCGYIC